MENKAFQGAIDAVMGSEPSREGIGRLGEKPLHAILKHYIEPNIERHEQKIGRYFADIEQDGRIFEIQTRSFNTLRGKLDFFLKERQVTLVYPIAAHKWIFWINPETGEVSFGRKSPKKGCIQDIMPELYKIKSFLHHKNLSLHLCFLEIEEYRLLNGWSHDKKKGSSCHQRIPTKLIEEVFIAETGDYEKFLPENLAEQFTAKDYAKIAKVTVGKAQTALNILFHLEIIERVGKVKNAYLYEVKGV